MPYREAGDGIVALGKVVLCDCDVTKGLEEDRALVKRGGVEEVTELTTRVVASSGSPQAAPERHASRRPGARAVPSSSSPRAVPERHATPPPLFPIDVGL